MKRWELLNELVRGLRAKSYLEIGCRSDTTFNRVQCKTKIGVDPVRGGTHRCTSDQFFERLDKGEIQAYLFDLIFVDGLHHASQVLKDVANSLRYASDKGVIVLHDCLPTYEYMTRVVHDDGTPITTPPDNRAWTGDVWKAMAALRYEKDLDCATLNEDHGLGVILQRTNTSLPTLSRPPAFTWSDYIAYQQTLLRVMNVYELYRWIGLNDQVQAPSQRP